MYSTAVYSSRWCVQYSGVRQSVVSGIISILAVDYCEKSVEHIWNLRPRSHMDCPCLCSVSVTRGQPRKILVDSVSDVPMSNVLSLHMSCGRRTASQDLNRSSMNFVFA